MSWFRWNGRSLAPSRMCSAQLLCAAALAASLLACKGDTKPLTQIVVGVDSDWDGFDHIKIDIHGFEKSHTIDVDGLKDDPLPRHVAIVHDGGPLGPMSVTVRAYVAGRDQPVLIEPRTGIYFEKDKTRLLMVHLLLDCAGKCDAKQACIAPAQCVHSDDAAKLSNWNGAIHPIKVSYHVGEGDTLREDGGVTPVHDGAVAGSGGDTGAGGAPGMQGGAGSSVGNGGSGGDTGGGSGGGGGGSGSGGMSVDPVDAGDSGTTPGMITPSNVDMNDSKIAGLSPVNVTLDCSSPAFDSSDMSFSGWCGDEPPATFVAQDGSHDAAVLVMSSLAIATDTTLRLTGDKPIILLVYGSANIAGTIDASAHGTSAGPGADRDCTTGIGATGEDGSPSMGSAGGGGGGFGSAGGRGSAGDGSMNFTSAGTTEGDASLVPLRGGCSGGRSGDAPNRSTYGAGGGGGGAVQISVLGQLGITGKILATGGGGQAGVDAGSGAGGGGSGGAILLEATTLVVDTNAVISANGGGGGAGQPYPLGNDDSGNGEDGRAAAMAAAGGKHVGIGGDGGNGAWGSMKPQDGKRPMSGTLGGSFTVWGGGGGGGGGVGWIRLNQAATCAPGGTITPAPSVVCTP